MNKNLKLLKIYEALRDEVDKLEFSAPVEKIYNPLAYAWDGAEKYFSLFQSFNGQGKIIFLGMNPGPWGMAQTGVPFGEVEAVKNFLGLKDLKISKPENESSSYKIEGLECKRSEVSGKRLWSLFKDRFGTAQNFFQEHLVLNYCPLLFLTTGKNNNGLRNLTPDKLKKSEQEKLFAACDKSLAEICEALDTKFLVGVGNFSYNRASEALKDSKILITKILHPSPASPQSNKNWSAVAAQQLIDSKVWSD